MKIECDDAQLVRGNHPSDPESKKQRKGKNRNMKDENKRTLYLKVRVSPEEMDAIKKKFQNSGMDSLSGFIRAMIFEGYIVQVNENELHEIYKLAGNIASNINQIAVRVNSTGNIYNNDIAEIKESVNKLWQPLNFLKTKVLQLKH
ncbi:MAG: plasmid mobilization protein [Porcipelethomonas sp.]